MEWKVPCTLAAVTSNISGSAIHGNGDDFIITAKIF